MGLFSKWWRRAPAKPTLFSERELDFNKESLDRAIVKTSEALWEYRNDQSHKVFADYLRLTLNREILQLADGKVDGGVEAYAYRRGRVDALRQALNAREVFLANKETLRKTQKQDPNAAAGKRSYVRAPATQAGLSI